MLHIRKIKPEDIGFVMGLATEKHGVEGRLLSNIENFLICENDGIKCGCGCLVAKEDKGCVGWVIVDEKYRRNKLGSAITKALLNIADYKGIKEVYAAGICGDFLATMGFEETECKSVLEAVKAVLGDTDSQKCYRVSLEGYFKPCNQK
ncbi:MAG TPA: GNAT family N-acetyltransferase [Clostridia bacterium]|nr:GNAT family N-acetyltransferase [Clostridia bacterium]